MFKRDDGKRAIFSCQSSEEATEGSPLSFMLRVVICCGVKKSVTGPKGIRPRQVNKALPPKHLTVLKCQKCFNALVPSKPSMLLISSVCLRKNEASAIKFPSWRILFIAEVRPLTL